jgi:hypothetical protein
VTRCNRARHTKHTLGATAAASIIALLAGCSEPPPEEAVAEHIELFGKYCTDCHNDAEAAGDMSLEHVTPASVAAKPEVFEQVIRKLRGGLMPPPGEPRPAAEDRRALVAALERHLDATAAARGPEPGRVALHRMNRTEYAAAVEQLLGVHIDARSMLPADMASEGFDNVAEVLRVTPTHIEQYVAAARDISIMAVGEKAPAPTRADYRSERGLRTAHVDGLPLGTRDGLVVEHDFPADGTYEINLTISSIPGSELRGYPYGWLEYEHTVAVTIDGEKVFGANIGGEIDSKALDQGQIKEVEAIKNRFRGIRVDVKAGRRNVGAAFIARSFAEGDYLLQSLVPGEGVPDIPRLYGMEILGPYDPTGIAEPTESRARIFSCYPQNESEEQACATQVLTNLARGAFRRPVTSEDVASALEFYAQGRAQGDFENGIQKGLMAILASTKFLYRADPSPPPLNVEPGSQLAVSDLELAWRLSFFLWSQGPDDALLELAQTGTLHEPDVLERQVHRMLADERSRSLVTNFAFQWLGVRRLDAIDPDPRLYPTFDEDLRRAFTKEMELFLDSVLRSDTSVVNLLTANYTFANERLARHYGLPNVRGDQFRRVELRDPHRFRLVRQGQRADGDVVSRSHVARAARRLDHGADPRGAAESAAARRRDQSRSLGRGAEIRARAAQAASHADVVQPMPRRHRPARPSARELRPHRRMAAARARHRRDRRLDGHDLDRHTREQSRRAARGAIERSDAIRADADREAHDVRARARPSVLRHARCAPHRGGCFRPGL